MRIQKQTGDWTRYREQFALATTDEIDLHFDCRDYHTAYHDAMAGVAAIVEGELQRAQKNGRPYVMFKHGWSTSRRGKTTARSVVRGFMRSPAATPLIDRSGCIQHYAVFVAKVRPLRSRCAASSPK